MGLWTTEHLVTILPTFAVMILVSIFMRKLLINKSYEVRMIPIKVIAIILVLIEIGKQVCSAVQGYDLYHITLHFCSMFVYVLPLFAFYRGKGEKNVRSITCAAMTSLFFGMIVMPDVIYSSEKIATFFSDYLAFHTVFFHNLVIFALFLTLALDLHRPSGSRGEVRFVIMFTSVFVAIAASASYILQTNYSNFLYSTVGIVKTLTESVKLSIGEVPTKIIYTATLAVLHIILLVLTYYIYLTLCIAKEKLSAIIKNKTN